MSELRAACKELFAEKMKSLHVAPPRTYWTDAFYSSAEWKLAKYRVYIRDGRRCVRCFGIDRLNVDHIIPRSKVPALALDELNLQVLCWPCNSAKNTRVDVDFVL